MHPYREFVLWSFLMVVSRNLVFANNSTLGIITPIVDALGAVALAFTAASSKSDQAAVERLLAEHSRAGFTPA